MARDIQLGDTFIHHFTTRQFSTGAPFALAGTPAVSVYEEENLTQITAGVTLTTSLDSVTGFNSVEVVATAANGYEAGKTYSIVITTGTVDSVSVVGEVLETFGIENEALSRLEGYSGGIWFDSDNGSNPATATFGVDGKDRRPVNNAADLDTLITASGYKTVYVAGDLVLNAASYAGINFIASDAGATLDFNGKAVGECTFDGLGILQTTAPTGDDYVFNNCTLGAAVSLGKCTLNGCTVTNTLTCNATTGTRWFNRCMFNSATFSGFGASDFAIINEGLGSFTITTGQNANAFIVNGGSPDITDRGAVLASSNDHRYAPRTWNSAWDAEVQSEVDDALQAYSAAKDTDITTAFTEIKGATWASGTDTLEAIRDATGNSSGSILTTTVNGVPANQTTFVLASGSADDDAYNGCTVVFTDASTATQKCVGIVSDYDGATTTITLAADPGVFTIADTDAIEIFPPQAGDIAARDTAIAANQTDLDAIIAEIGTATDTDIATDIANVLTAAAAAEAAVNADAIAEATGDPGATPTLQAAIMLLYMALRNKVDVTATTKEIHNNAGTVIATKTLSDTGTVYSETKIA